MRPISDYDIAWCVKRLHPTIVKVMQEHGAKIVCAGGFIRSCIANEPIQDIDLFVPSAEFGRQLAQQIARAHGSAIHTTENAITISGPKTPIQIITRWVFQKPEDVIASFDFTIACAAFWWELSPYKDGKQDPPKLYGGCDDRFYEDLAARRLVYRAPIRNEDAGGSMLRVLKFYQRGYRIPLDSLGAVMGRMFKDYNSPGDMGDMERERHIAKVMTGFLREVDPNTFADLTAHLPAMQHEQATPVTGAGPAS